MEVVVVAVVVVLLTLSHSDGSVLVAVVFAARNEHRPGCVEGRGYIIGDLTSLVYALTYLVCPSIGTEIAQTRVRTNKLSIFFK